jgi:hypothetical protein
MYSYIRLNNYIKLFFLRLKYILLLLAVFVTSSTISISSLVDFGTYPDKSHRVPSPSIKNNFLSIYTTINFA